MFDLDISKMAVIGLVALIVLGPERLPRVARTAGALLGRAQRYISDVKSEVTREIELEEIRKMKSGLEEAASSVQNTIHDTVRQHTEELTEAWHGSSDAAPPPGGFTSTLTDSQSSDPQPSDWTRRGSLMTASSPGSKGPRRNWRVRQAATPVWYKRASVKRTNVVSGAARVALEARTSQNSATLASTASTDNAAAAPARRPIRFL
jgi:sec-independent protein translocase protein TatB